MRINAPDAPKIRAEYEKLEEKERKKAKEEQLIWGGVFFGKLNFPGYKSLCALYGFPALKDQKEFGKWLREYTKNQEKREERYAKENGVPEGYVRYKKKTDREFLLLFAQNPTRETIHQAYAIETIKKNLPYFSSFCALPAGGKNAKYIVGGEIVGQEERKKAERAVKSIDAEGTINLPDSKIHVYFSLKYTKDSGGAQDNQYADLISFLKEGTKSKEKDVYFIALADGEYYQKRETKYAKKEGQTRLEYLNSAFGKHCKAAALDEIEVSIIEIILENMPEEEEKTREALRKRLMAIKEEKK